MFRTDFIFARRATITNVDDVKSAFGLIFLATMRIGVKTPTQQTTKSTVRQFAQTKETNRHRKAVVVRDNLRVDRESFTGTTEQ